MNPRDPLSTESVKLWLASEYAQGVCTGSEHGWEEERAAMHKGIPAEEWGRKVRASG